MSLPQLLELPALWNLEAMERVVSPGFSALPGHLEDSREEISRLFLDALYISKRWQEWDACLRKCVAVTGPYLLKSDAVGNMACGGH